YGNNTNDGSANSGADGIRSQRRSYYLFIQIRNAGGQCTRIQNHCQVFSRLRIHMTADLDLIANRLVDRRNLAHLTIQHDAKAVFYVRPCKAEETLAPLPPQLAVS